MKHHKSTTTIIHEHQCIDMFRFLLPTLEGRVLFFRWNGFCGDNSCVHDPLRRTKMTSVLVFVQSVHTLLVRSLWMIPQ
jgi:hypothetical protein